MPCWIGDERGPSAPGRTTIASPTRRTVPLVAWPLLRTLLLDTNVVSDAACPYPDAGVLRRPRPTVIAATAVTSGLTLVTRNLSDFTDFDRLWSMSWWTD